MGLVSCGVTGYPSCAWIGKDLAIVHLPVTDAKPLPLLCQMMQMHLSMHAGVFEIHKEKQKLLCTIHVDRARRKSRCEHTSRTSRKW